MSSYQNFQFPNPQVFPPAIRPAIVAVNLLSRVFIYLFGWVTTSFRQESTQIVGAMSGLSDNLDIVGDELSGLKFLIQSHYDSRKTIDHLQKEIALKQQESETVFNNYTEIFRENMALKDYLKEELNLKEEDIASIIKRRAKNYQADEVYSIIERRWNRNKKRQSSI